MQTHTHTCSNTQPNVRVQQWLEGLKGFSPPSPSALWMPLS